jgi:hypothetical protein
VYVYVNGNEGALRQQSGGGVGDVLGAVDIQSEVRSIAPKTSLFSLPN